MRPWGRISTGKKDIHWRTLSLSLSKGWYDRVTPSRAGEKKDREWQDNARPTLYRPEGRQILKRAGLHDRQVQAIHLVISRVYPNFPAVASGSLQSALHVIAIASRTAALTDRSHAVMMILSITMISVAT